MQLDYSENFLAAYERAPEEIKKKFKKQSLFLIQNLRHPSLRAKKYSEPEKIWQARVNGSWRFYFMIKADTYYLLDIIPHPK